MDFRASDGQIIVPRGPSGTKDRRSGGLGVSLAPTIPKVDKRVRPPTRLSVSILLPSMELLRGNELVDELLRRVRGVDPGRVGITTWRSPLAEGEILDQVRIAVSAGFPRPAPDRLDRRGIVAG